MGSKLPILAPGSSKAYFGAPAQIGARRDPTAGLLSSEASHHQAPLHGHKPRAQMHFRKPPRDLQNIQIHFPNP